MDPVDQDLAEYFRALDAEKARDIFLEQLQDEIKDDPEEKGRLALLYAEAHEDTIPEKPFLEWAAERLFDELNPAYENGWDERPTNKEYWNFNDDRI